VEALRDDHLEVWREAALALHRLNWKPEQDTEAGSKAAYWVATKNWEQCATVGESAIPRILSYIGSLKVSEPLELAKTWLPRRSVLTVEDKAQALAALRRIGQPACDALISALRANKVTWRQDPAVASWLLNLSPYYPLDDAGPVDAAWTAKQLEDGLYSLHTAAFAVLTHLRDPRTISGLLVALSDPERRVRESALNILADLKEQRAASAIAANLEGFGSLQVIKALGAIGGPEANNVLAAHLKEWGREAAEFIALDGDDRGISWLIQFLRQNEEHSVARSLGKAFFSPRLTQEQREHISQHADLPVLRKWDAGYWAGTGPLEDRGWISDPKSEPVTLQWYLIDPGRLLENPRIG